jgi:hypothetical protein
LFGVGPILLDETREESDNGSILGIGEVLLQAASYWPPGCTPDFSNDRSPGIDATSFQHFHEAFIWPV